MKDDSPKKSKRAPTENLKYREPTRIDATPEAVEKATMPKPPQPDIEWRYLKDKLRLKAGLGKVYIIPGKLFMMASVAVMAVSIYGRSSSVADHLPGDVDAAAGKTVHAAEPTTLPDCSGGNRLADGSSCRWKVAHGYV